MGFCFDSDARMHSIETLSNQIPHLIYPDPEGMTFGELFATTCNLSPASADIYREAIAKLIDLNELEVLSQDGSNRRAAHRIHDSDQVLAPKQRRLFV
jgi:hypothetical protein